MICLLCPECDHMLSNDEMVCCATDLRSSQLVGHSAPCCVGLRIQIAQLVFGCFEIWDVHLLVQKYTGCHVWRTFTELCQQTTNQFFGPYDISYELQDTL